MTLKPTRDSLALSKLQGSEPPGRLTLKRPPGVKFAPSLRFFFSITFLVYLTMTPTFLTCRDKFPLGQHSGFVLLVITVFLKISIFPLWGQI